MALTQTTPNNFFGSLGNEVSEDDLLKWTKDIPYPAVPNDGSSHIRLVLLEPGKRNKDVTVQIVSVLFAEAPAYEAISYAWGAVSITEPISVNGLSCQIPVNLLAFFRQRQSRLLDRSPLWIDALCIDQTSPADKKAQITHMAKIYNRCTQFTIWLGEESETSAIAVNTLTRIGSMEKIDPFFELKGRARSSIIEFLKRSWWTRVWIVQEVAMAANPGVARMMCGKHKLLWIHMARAALHLKDITDFHTDADIDVNPLLELTLTLERARHRQNDANTLDAPTLLDLLVQNRYRKATDPRDKVFALLGLLRNHQWRVQIELDYRMSWTELYRKVVVYEVQTTWSLNILRYSNPERQQGLDESSWSPDWSQIPCRRLLRAPLGRRPYTASADFVADPDGAHFTGRTLTTKTVLLGVIQGSFPLPSLVPTDVVSRISLLMAISECKRHLLELASKEGATPYGNIDGQCEALWRTLFLDHFESGADGRFLAPASPVSRQKSIEPIPSGWKPQLPKRDLSKSSHVRAYSSGSISHTSHHDWLPVVPCSWRLKDPKRWPRGIAENDKPRIWAVLSRLETSFDLAAHPFNFYVPDVYQHHRAKNEPDVQGHKAFFKEQEKEILTFHVDRALFVTEKGYIGLGPGRCKTGDVVAVLAGADVPFVLEPRAASRNNACSLVGEAYVHGFMHGEAVRSIEAGESDWEHIVVR